MGRVFDEADYRGRLKAAENEIGSATELKFIARGDLQGLRAEQAHRDAKINALRQARKQMLRAIDKEQADRALNGFLPESVEEIVTGPSDELVKIDGGVGK
ncbi:hypothetical protein ACT4MK_10070 [Bradyrhizobium barranii]|uniref:hypothetical protein n=1 Tax=Bradyrhizobium TaxID=374 RepID=UPI003F25B7A1